MLEWKDFKEQTIKQMDRITIGYIQWEKKNIKCPKCGQPLYKNMTEVFTSYPPQYEYRCLNCNWHDYAYH